MNDLPEDLAHPRDNHASAIASIVTGILLLGILAGLLWWIL